MNLTLSDQQVLIVEAIGDLLDRYMPSDGRHLADWRAMWRDLAADGWLAAAVPEGAGGMALGADDLGLLSRAFGRAAAPSPFGEVAIAGAGLIAALAPEGSRDAWLSPILAGRALAVPLLEQVEAIPACKVAGEWVMSRGPLLVRWGAVADHFLVPVRCDGVVALARIAPDTAGVLLTAYPTIEPVHACRIQLTDVVVSEADLFGHGEAEVAWAALRDRAIAQVCNDAVGAMERLLELTGAYWKGNGLIILMECT